MPFRWRRWRTRASGHVSARSERIATSSSRCGVFDVDNIEVLRRLRGEAVRGDLARASLAYPSPSLRGALEDRHRCRRARRASRRRRARRRISALRQRCFHASASVLDPYAELVRMTLKQRPRLRARRTGSDHRLRVVDPVIKRWLRMRSSRVQLSTTVRPMSRGRAVPWLSRGAMLPRPTPSEPKSRRRSGLSRGKR